MSDALSPTQEPPAPLIFQWEIEHKERHRDWLLRMAAVAEPATADLFRREAHGLSRAIKQARERA